MLLGFTLRARRLLLASFVTTGSLAAGCSSDRGTGGAAVDAPRSNDERPGGSDASSPPTSSGGKKPPGARPEDEAPYQPALPVPDLYDPDLIPHFELVLDAAAVALLSSPKEEDKKTWVHGTFKFAGVTMADVGVRRKGSYSFRALPQKASLKIKFNKFKKGQKLGGLEELTLNNNMSDHTYLEQRLSLHVFRSMGLPASAANSSRLTINGEDYGVYTNVETPDEQFLERVFGAKAKTLYEVAEGADWMPGADHNWEDDVAAKDEPEGTRTDLHRLFEAVKSARDESLLSDLEGHLHTKHFLRYSAAEAITGQHDGYAYGFYGSHNYFMAGDVDGKFSLVPWSTDTTFVASIGKDIDVAKPMPEDVLLARCSRAPSCWTAYKTEMTTALAEFEALDLLALAKKWHAQIDDIARADPKREIDESYYEEMTAKTYAWIEGRAAVVRAQLGLVTP